MQCLLYLYTVDALDKTYSKFSIEDVERGAELSFSGRGPLRGPPSASSSNFSPKCFGFFGFRQDRQTDGRTDRRNKYVLGLPCFKKLSSEFQLS